MPTFYISECPAPWADMLALGQTNKTSTENLNQVMWPP